MTDNEIRNMLAASLVLDNGITEEFFEGNIDFVQETLDRIPAADLERYVAHRKQKESEPPGYRKADSCAECDWLCQDNGMRCRKHDFPVYTHYICEDFERKGE